MSWKSERTLFSLKASLAALLALWIAWLFKIHNPTWAAWTAFAVVQVSRGATIRHTLERILATLAGVSAAWILLGLLNVPTPLLLSISIIALTICLYFSAKSQAPFVWLYGPITFLLVLFSSPGLISSPIVAETAYYRGLEVTIGSLCALLITLLFQSPSAAIRLNKNNIELFKKLSALQSACFDLYRFNQKDPDFKVKMTELVQLAEIQMTLQRFVPKKNDWTLGQIAFIAQEMMLDLYVQHHHQADQIFSSFSRPLEALEKAITATFEGLIQGGAPSFLRWQESLSQLMQEAAVFREHHAADFSAEAIMEWNQFLVRQEAFLILMQNFNHEMCGQPTRLPFKTVLGHFFIFDRIYWEYAFKVALLVVLLPFIAIHLHLTGVVLLSLVTALSLQFDLSISRARILQIVTGCLIGTGAALVFMLFNFTHLVPYLLAVAGVSFILAYMKYAPDRLNLSGLFSAYLFFTNVMEGLGPLESAKNAVQLLLIALGGALFLFIFISWIWPFSDKKVAQHYQAQLDWYRAVIQSSVIQSIDQPSLFLRRELNGLRQQIKTFSGFHWQGPIFGKKMQALATLWYRDYHLLAGIVLSLQGIDLTEQDPRITELTKRALSFNQNALSLAALIQDLSAYQDQLRQRFLTGDRLPFVDSIKIIHLLTMLQNLSVCRNDVLKVVH